MSPLNFSNKKTQTENTQDKNTLKTKTPHSKPFTELQATHYKISKSWNKESETEDIEEW